MAEGKLLIRYSTMLTQNPSLGRSVFVIPTEHPSKGEVGKMHCTGGITDIIEVIGDDRPVFATDYSVYVPDRRV